MIGYFIYLIAGHPCISSVCLRLSKKRSGSGGKLIRSTGYERDLEDKQISCGPNSTSCTDLLKIIIQPIKHLWNPWGVF